MSKAEEFRKKYLGLQYNQVNTLTPFAIDEMLQAYADQENKDRIKRTDEAVKREDFHNSVGGKMEYLQAWVNKLKQDQ